MIKNDRWSLLNKRGQMLSIDIDGMEILKTSIQMCLIALNQTIRCADIDKEIDVPTLELTVSKSTTLLKQLEAISAT